MISTTLKRYAAGLEQPVHCHDEPSVTLLVRGQLRERSGSIDVSPDPLSIVVKPSGLRHANLFGSMAVVTCQIVLDATAHDDGRWQRSIDRWRWVPGGPAVTAALRLAGSLAAGDDRYEGKLELAEAVLDALDGDTAHGRRPPWLDKAIAFIEDELARGTQRIRTIDVATAIGVHRVHLARVFQRHQSVAVVTWIQRRRVQRAAERLGRSNETLSQVSAAMGFADQSHMNRTFRRHLGLLPSPYRGLVRALLDQAAHAA
jgi:AraC family transcriptional regulator